MTVTACEGRYLKSKKEEVRGGWRKLRNYSFIICNISATETRWRILAGRFIRKKEKQNSYRNLMGNLGRQRLLGRQRGRWEDNETGFKQYGWLGVNCIQLTQHRTSGELC